MNTRKRDNQRAIVRALEHMILFLEGLPLYLGREITKDTALLIVERTLSNFHMHMCSMYRDTLHKKSTLRQSVLGSIQIENEYDLQRFMYSFLLPIFPTIRQEVDSDNGYCGMRADIFLDEYDLVLELKKTSAKMTEKQLSEQLGADAFHYKASTIYLFVYDKHYVIKNIEAFKKSFKREYEKDGKTVRVFVSYPIVGYSAP